MLRKKMAALALGWGLCTTVVFAQSGPASTPTVASGISTFDLAPDNIGQVKNSVNLFSGDLNLPLNLVSLAGKDGLGVNVGITYNSNVQNQVDRWNLEAPTGILGLGWTLDIPKIICDHKSTGTREDDVFYLLEAQTSNQLIRTGSGTDNVGTYHSYALKKYRFWQLRFYYDPADYTATGSPSTGPNKWVIVKENGFSYVYGDVNSGRSTVLYSVRWNNWIGSSSLAAGQSQIATTWNLSEVDNLWGEKITYQYNKVEQLVGGANGLEHTEASYLAQITDPVGRKIQFVYNNKSPQFFMEPHTEAPEPDAYQENYERQYLDHINVLQETGMQYLSINFRYTGINDVSGSTTAKMLLSYVEQRNNQGQAMPGLHFDYFTTTSTSGYKGFLQRITYPTGGTVTYSYVMSNNALGHANRAFTIFAPGGDSNAPYGYAEPSVWFGPDYAVVAWRGIAGYLESVDQNNNVTLTYNHSTGPMAVKLSVYQWVGEWVKRDLTGIQNVSATFVTGANQSTDAANYQDFQVITENKFFAVLSHPQGGSTYDFNLFYKDETARGVWQQVTRSFDFGSGSKGKFGNDVGQISTLPTLTSGDNFVVAGSFLNSTTYPSHIFTFTGSSFTETTTGYPVGTQNYYTGANNYFIDFYDEGISGFPPQITSPFINLSYLSEEKIWSSVILPSAVTYEGWTSDGYYSPSFWYGANSCALSMAGSNPEFLYTWDVNYSNFVRDNGAGSLLGQWPDNSYVFQLDNSSFGLVDDEVRARALRYNGANWIVSSQHTCSSGDFGGAQNVGLGSDFLVSSDDPFDPNGPNGGVRRMSTFDPNNPVAWTQTIHSGNSFRPTVSNNIFLDVGDNVGYYRMPDGSWNLIGSTQGYLMNDCLVSGSATYDIINGGYSASYVDPIGTQNTHFSDVDQFGRWIVVTLHSGNIMASFSLPTNIVGPTYRDANGFTLYYDVQGHLLGNQVDYPVASITISGTNSVDQNVAFSYNFTTATIDPSGTVAEYAEVNVFPGTVTPSFTSSPSGYTKTFFNNGLSNTDDNGIPFSGQIDPRGMGLPYQNFVYDKNNTKTASTTSNYLVASLIVNNSASNQVDLAYSITLSSAMSIMDGISMTTYYSFDVPANNSVPSPSQSGLILSKSTYPTANPTETEETDYTYAFTINSILANIHLYSPLAQITRKKNGSVVQSKVMRYQLWPANNLGPSSTVPAVFDELVWNGTNSYNFSSWDVNAYPSSSLSDWTLGHQITLRDAFCGTPIETLSKGNIPSAILLDQYKIRTVATVPNANFNQVAYTSFEDEAKGNWTYPNQGTPVSAKTGNKSYDLDASGLTASNLLTTENYVLSFWAKSSGGTVAISGQQSFTINSTGWTYYEFAVTNINLLTIQLQGLPPVSIDEVRLYPKRASMTTRTYDLVFGETSQSDNNNRTAYTQYDQWGRVLTVSDENKSIIKSLTYNQKK